MDESMEELRRAAIIAMAGAQGFAQHSGNPFMAQIESTIDWLAYQSNRDAREVAIATEEFIQEFERSILPTVLDAIELLKTADRSGLYDDHSIRNALLTQLERLGCPFDPATDVIAHLPFDAAFVLSLALPQFKDRPQIT
jgi:hypothetical protein